MEIEGEQSMAEERRKINQTLDEHQKVLELALSQIKLQRESIDEGDKKEEQIEA